MKTTLAWLDYLRAWNGVEEQSEQFADVLVALRAEWLRLQLLPMTVEPAGAAMPLIWPAATAR